MTTRLTREAAREYLLGQLGLRRVLPGAPPIATRRLVRALRCIQLDPLDPMGTNADLVAWARVDGLARGGIYAELFPHHAFEHFAKERCLLPAAAFPYYRARAIETPWWRASERLRRLPSSALDSVLEEVRRQGPIAARDLADRGAVEPLDWGGWKGTAKVTAMALEVLWTRCEVVVCGRSRRGKVYAAPEQVFGEVPVRAAGDFERWALLERVEAAGLLARAGGAHWSTLRDARTSGLVETLLREGALEEVCVDGAPRTYLAPAGFRRRRFPADDGRLRILGPLDPLLWDRTLVHHVFGFEYVWEVYKPASARRWGWYVCPLLHRGALVGRLEGRVDGDALVVDRLWRERGARLDDDALDDALARHARACGVTRVVRSRRARRSVRRGARSGAGP